MAKIFKVTFLLFGAVIIFLTGCRKDSQAAIYSSSATVVQVKFACGTSCDALGFIIKTNCKELFTPIDLGLEYRLNNLPVKIRYKNTGKLPKTYTAPNYELIELLQISR